VSIDITSEHRLLSRMEHSDMQSKKPSRAPFDSATLRALAIVTNMQAGD
jgi:hypothetical protein